MIYYNEKNMRKWNDETTFAFMVEELMQSFRKMNQILFWAVTDLILFKLLLFQAKLRMDQDIPYDKRMQRVAQVLRMVCTQFVILNSSFLY